MNDSTKGTGISFKEASARFMGVFGEQEPLMRPIGVKLIPQGKEIPETSVPPEEYQGTPWCGAVRIAATENETVVITKENVGCPAAAIALGLVDEYDREPLGGRRKYTDMMKEIASPADFTFTARFGLSRQKTRKAGRLPELDLSGVPVLIVDDNATNRSVFQGMTSSWGFVPTDAADGKEALAKINKAFESGNPYRLMLLDSQIPGLDGFEVAKRLKESPCGVPLDIILLTSVGQKGDAALCREMGISGYLTKPVKQSEVYDAIMMVMGHPTGEIPVITRHTIHEVRNRLDILLAEDNIVNQKLAVKLLEKRGHRVVVASNGKEAIQKLEARHFDLVLMDVQMPEMDGIEATKLIRKREEHEGGHIPIAAMTANAMKGDREKCLAAGMDGYVSKPIKVEKFFEVIDNIGTWTK